MSSRRFAVCAESAALAIHVLRRPSSCFNDCADTAAAIGATRSLTAIGSAVRVRARLVARVATQRLVAFVIASPAAKCLRMEAWFAKCAAGGWRCRSLTVHRVCRGTGVGDACCPWGSRIAAVFGLIKLNRTR